MMDDERILPFTIFVIIAIVAVILGFAMQHRLDEFNRYTKDVTCINGAYEMTWEDVPYYSKGHHGHIIRTKDGKEYQLELSFSCIVVIREDED